MCLDEKSGPCWGQPAVTTAAVSCSALAAGMVEWWAHFMLACGPFTLDRTLEFCAVILHVFILTVVEPIIYRNASMLLLLLSLLCLKEVALSIFLSPSVISNVLHVRLP